MSLRKKAVLLIGAIAVFTSIGVYLVSYRLIREKFDRLEDRRVRLNLERIQSAFRHETDHLEALAADYATWDSTYRYMRDRYPAYTRAELSDETFTTYHLRAYLLIDTAGEVVLCRDYGSRDSLCRHRHESDRLLDTARRLAGPSWELDGSGVFLNDSGPMLIAVRPVLRTDGGGPSRGALVMARPIDDRTVLSMGRLLGFPLQAFRPNTQDVSRRYSPQLASVSGTESQLVEAVDNRAVAGFIRVDDVNGAPAIVFRTELSRDLHQEGIVVQRVLFAELFAIVLLIAGVAFLVLQKAILRPISALSATADKITGSGDLSARTEIGGDDEFGRLGSTFNAMLEELESSRKELLLVQEALEYRVRHDGLTSLLNRDAIIQELMAESARSGREGSTTAVMMADLDHFKRINDAFGHAAGDEALRRVSHVIRSSVRAYDRVGRFGGEEFIILAPNVSRENAIGLAERIRSAVGAMADRDQSGGSATVSIGVTLTDGSVDWRDVVSAADAALYRAKNGGRDRVEFVSCSINGAAARSRNFMCDSSHNASVAPRM
ncbi:MAG TPA: diguanylate cyclase [Terriglobales bacterium]|nr:diguanylate cyclase [Terriglobales bacterium]